MDSGNIVSKADKYKEELMRLYGKRVMTGENAEIKEEAHPVSSNEVNNEKIEEIIEETEENVEEANEEAVISENDESFQEVSGEADQGNADESDDIERRYPQPDLSELVEGEPSVPDNSQQERCAMSPPLLIRWKSVRSRPITTVCKVP